MKKKIIILSGALSLMISFSANAQVSITFGEPEPSYVEAPAYVSPTPVYPTYAVEPARYHRYHVQNHGRRHGHR